MSRIELQDMTLDQLVQRFVMIALAQDEALLMNEVTKFNRLFDWMDDVKEELKNRAGDQRRMLFSLYDHPNAQVRLKAAIATLAIAPEEARRVLQIISDRQEYPQAADARGIMRAVDDGRLTPT